ncbi:nucleotidyltransferase family protein [Comamonadaceae bacterium M7527]|nr:nucleotidyltransferase family protein [Comamonadaceae bacterium M7527]
MTTTAMLLAAGRGERMRPLTDTCPKPLLPVKGRPLMSWTMAAMQRGGISHAVINTAWLGAQIEATFGAQDHGLQLRYSHEGADFGHALETAGGIARALPQLGPVFWLAAGDVYAPAFVFSAEAANSFAASNALAHLFLVPNPAHNPHGDFALAANGRLSHAGQALVCAQTDARYTYSTIGLFKAALFQPPYCDIAPGNATGQTLALAPVLRRAMDDGLVSGELYKGQWVDVGTPQRLEQLNLVDTTNTSATNTINPTPHTP